MQNKNDRSLFGVDINEYTQSVDFAVLSTKIDFLYLRASGSASGRFRTDRKFVDFAQKSREFGIPVGAYHFGVPADDLTTADSQFGNKDYGDLFPVIDVEVPTDKSLAVETVVNWIDRFRKRFEKKTRRRIMLYTGTFYVELYNNFFIPGRGYPLKNMILWIAMYTSIPGNPAYPPDVGGWTRWRVWQYSENATVQGIGNPVDANWGPNSIDLLIQPRNVTGLSATKRGNTINIRWNRNTDADLLGYNLFANGYWIGTVDANDTDFSIPVSALPFTQTGPIKISIEAFDLDGETSKGRATVTV